ncbi:hypothetical protein Tco_1197106, partial [Tanacetum coccineum]
SVGGWKKRKGQSWKEESPIPRYKPPNQKKQLQRKKRKFKNKAINRRKPPSPDNRHPPDLTVTIGGNLTTECKIGLIGILRKHADAFAWTPADMIGIPHFIAKHELKTCPHIEPRVQIKGSIAPDRRKVMKEEVVEWLKYGIIKRVRYPLWVANPVLVKKLNNSWMMCIDFKDLNKACPKDLYPL